MKAYCTQNNGDCQSCSLMNYGRDCKNNPIENKKRYQYYLDTKMVDEAKKQLEKFETMSDFVREALEREIKRRKIKNN